MKNFFALLLVVLLASASRPAAAQEALPSGKGNAGDLPPDMSEALPSGQDDASAIPNPVPSDGENIQPVPEGYDDGTVAGSFGNATYDPMHLGMSCPALFESSGTFLRRGFWYAEGDYLFLNESWDRKGLLFAFEGTTSAAPGFTNPTGVSQPGFGPVLTLNSLTISGRPPADGMARVTLGRFLFRDYKNRDHALQFTYLGGGDWKQNSRIQSATTTGFNVNDFIDRVNPSFDGSQEMAFDAETKLNSIESNYVVKSRLGKDQMVLQPNGDWVRSAQTSQTYSFLAGVRYVQVTDDLNITAERNPDVATSEGGMYNVNTENHLLGGQLGASVAQETARWSIGVNVKGGSYWNRQHLDSMFTAGTEAAPTMGAVNSTEDRLAFVGEFQVLTKYHLRPNVSLRAGLNMIYVNQLALTAHQINFIEGGYPPIAGNDEIFCLGTSFGIEAYR